MTKPRHTFECSLAPEVFEKVRREVVAIIKVGEQLGHTNKGGFDCFLAGVFVGSIEGYGPSYTWDQFWDEETSPTFKVDGRKMTDMNVPYTDPHIITVSGWLKLEFEVVQWTGSLGRTTTYYQVYFNQEGGVVRIIKKK